ncbi:hypothetical protein D039_3383A, partial [Vibrio parahaemolyticus EKP-028]
MYDQTVARVNPFAN